MERLWTPWRSEYVSRTGTADRPGVPGPLSGWSRSGAPDKGCVFCNLLAAVDWAVTEGMPREEAERATHLLARGRFCFLILNAFPYSTGHVLIIPYQHCDSLAGLTEEASVEMMQLARRVEAALRAVYQPAGINFGVNLGEAAGAGIAAHVHMHALPRWTGDVNFMTAIADTRVLPETLDITWERLRPALRPEP